MRHTRQSIHVVTAMLETMNVTSIQRLAIAAAEASSDPEFTKILGELADQNRGTILSDIEVEMIAVFEWMLLQNYLVFPTKY